MPDTTCPPSRRPRSVFGRRESGTPSTAPQSIRPAAPVQEDSWLADVEHRIRGFAELPDDRDSYGAGPVPKSVVEAAVAIAAIMSDIGFSRPDVGPQSSGGVLLEWHHAGRTLTVDIDIAGGLSPDRGFSFAYESPGEREIEGDLEDFTGLLGAAWRSFASEGCREGIDREREEREVRLREVGFEEPDE